MCEYCDNPEDVIVDEAYDCLDKPDGFTVSKYPQWWPIISFFATHSPSRLICVEGELGAESWHVGIATADGRYDLSSPIERCPMCGEEL